MFDGHVKEEKKSFSKEIPNVKVKFRLTLSGGISGFPLGFSVRLWWFAFLVIRKIFQHFNPQVS